MIDVTSQEFVSWYDAEDNEAGYSSPDAGNSGTTQIYLQFTYYPTDGRVGMAK